MVIGSHDFVFQMVRRIPTQSQFLLGGFSMILATLTQPYLDDRRNTQMTGRLLSARPYIHTVGARLDEKTPRHIHSNDASMDASPFFCISVRRITHQRAMRDQDHSRSENH